MDERFPIEAFDDLLEPDDSLDPAQCVMHGLLLTYFEMQSGRSHARCEAILARIRAAEVRQPDRRRRARFRRWSLGLVATAALVLALFLIFSDSQRTEARALDLREIGFARPILVQGPFYAPEDGAIYDERLAYIEAQRVALAEALANGDDPWVPWTQLYRNLRALGMWEEALAQANTFLEYAAKRDQMPQRYTMYYTALFDIANYYAAIGDYEQAWEYHQQSLEVATDHIEWKLRTQTSGDDRSHRRETEYAVTLVPRLWALSALAAAEGHQPQAWTLHRRATTLLTEFFQAECADRGLAVKPDADLVALALAVQEDEARHAAGPPKTASLIVKVREHLLREARLHRLDRNLDAADQALDRAAAVPDYPFADESRLDFNEPMERLRIAIARGDFQTALAWADEAAKHTGPRTFPETAYLRHPPIDRITQAELQLLKGVALRGIDGTDSQGTMLMRSALDVVQRTSRETVSVAAKKQFLRRFEEWNRIAGSFP